MLQRSLLLMCLGGTTSRTPSGVSAGAAASTASSGKGLSHSVLIMSLQSNEHAFSLPWPTATASSPPAAGEYVSLPRSPFSIMRAKRTRTGRCATNLLPQGLGNVEASALPSAIRGGCCGGGHGGQRWCCCASLAYPTLPAQGNAASGTASPRTGEAGPVLATTDTEEVRHRDAFVLGLKLSNTEATLRAIVGDAVLEKLVGPALAHHSHTLALCADPSELLATAHSTHWTARTLLTADEENRIKWLWEETGELTHCYSRAPTLRALFVMWSIAQASASAAAPATNGSPRNTTTTTTTNAGPVPIPTTADIEQVSQRMADHQVDVTLCDMAALIAFAAEADAHVQDTIVRVLVRLASPEKVANAKVRRGLANTDLDLVLLLTALCQYAGSMRASAEAEADAVMAATTAQAATEAATKAVASGATADSGAAGNTGGSPAAARSAKDVASTTAHREVTGAEEGRLISIVRVATKMSDLRAELVKATATPVKGKDHRGDLPPRFDRAPHAGIVLTLLDRFLADARAIAASCDLPSTSSHINELTVWLLREMPSSGACFRHYQAVIDHGPMDALLMLEKSGLLGKRDVDLETVNHVILPLLEHCGNEDFFTLVMRDVIGLLEDRLRRDPHSFSDTDMKLLAELGTKLFAVTSASDAAATGGAGSFDIAAREQMEELHVMDGSPWALCVSSYRSLKEILQNLVRDHRRLKRQVQEQMRNISVATGNVLLGGANAEAEAAGAQPGRVAAAQGADATGMGATSSNDGTTRGDGDGAGRTTAGTAAVSSPCADGANDVQKRGSRMIASPVVRNRFLVFLEDLVKELVDDNVADSERPIVISSDLFAFVNRHVPVPNIQDEYRRKIFLLVNVAEDPETVRRRRRELRRQQRLEEKLKAEAYDKAHPGSREKGSHGSSRRRARLHHHHHTQRLTAAAGGPSIDQAAATSGDLEDVAADELEDDGDDLVGDLHGGAEEIPAELRFLVSSLPLTLSPWASVMILREVLAESAGRNPRYSYVLNAAIDLQLPMSTTRSRIATTLNMWRFLNSQSHKLTLKESVVMKQRCVFNLPLSYILSSYWSLLTSLVVACIIMLNVVGLDFESQLVANSLFQKFTPWEEVVDVGIEPWNTEAAADLASDYFEQDEIASKHRSPRRSSDVILSSASYLFLGYDDQRRPMTLIPISSDPKLSEEARSAEEFACAAAVLRELSLHAPFPFYLDLERPMSVEYVETRVAERIRRVSFNNTWFLPRMIIRTFPLGRQYTERMLITHTCSQANLTRRRITFLIYVEDGVPITQQFLRGLQDSFLSKSANLVLVVHERSLAKGGTTPRAVETIAAASSKTSPSAEADATDEEGSGEALRVLPYCRRLHDIPDGFFKHSQTSPAGRGTASGRGSTTATPSMLQSFSPFTKHFALHLPDDDTSDSGKRRFIDKAQAKERGVLSAVVSETMDVMVGATAATVNLAVMPLRYALRASGKALGLDTGSGASVADSASAEDGINDETKESMGIPHGLPSASNTTNTGEKDKSGAAAGASSYPRQVVSVPFSLVKEAMEKTTSTGQSAMRWLGGDDSHDNEASPSSKSLTGKSTDDAAAGNTVTRHEQLPTDGGRVDLKKAMGIVLEDTENGPDPAHGSGGQGGGAVSGLWSGIRKGWGVVKEKWHGHHSNDSGRQSSSSSLAQRFRTDAWWSGLLGGSAPKENTTDVTKGSSTDQQAKGLAASTSSLHPSVLPMMTPWERRAWESASTTNELPREAP